MYWIDIRLMNIYLFFFVTRVIVSVVILGMPHSHA